MSEDLIKTIATYISIVIPVTVILINVAKIFLAWLSQKHSINTSNIQLNHQIITNYLDRALDPNVPLAIRHQLLRFLSTPDKDGSRLSSWAESELNRIGEIVEEANKAVLDAEKELNEAKTLQQIKSAEEKLSKAFKKQKSLLEPPQKPPINAASLKAGLVEDQQLDGISLCNLDLYNMNLVYRSLKGADFSNSNLSSSSLQGCDLRGSTFENANLESTQFYRADLRGAKFQKAKISYTKFEGARLEGADFSEAIIKHPNLKATYDDTTKWPEKFNPDDFGGVFIGSKNLTE